ncbi:unnamed protein product, partial [Vitis vinifera]|uniref:Small ribosomal subunit protein eS31 domain-containing protein n=1 Tax=Vitis vinifera TaxID=29760 RepID=D7SYW1_VITVI
MPLGMAKVGYMFYRHVMRYNPRNPKCFHGHLWYLKDLRSVRRRPIPSPRGSGTKWMRSSSLICNSTRLIISEWSRVLRRDCLDSECCVGTFMASHLDRHYYAKCSLAYVYQQE